MAEGVLVGCFDLKVSRASWSIEKILFATPTKSGLRSKVHVLRGVDAIRR